MVIQDDRYTIPRDLVGYGEQGKDAQWPNGARIAVSICLNYEEGAEATVLNGDVGSEVWSWEKAGGTRFFGARQPNAESDYDYGARAGVWRLLRLFAQHAVRVTVLAVGRALELNPTVARAYVAAGHEVAGHGHRYLDARDLSPREEQDGVLRAITAIQRATGGVAPQGWYVGRASPNSLGAVCAAFAEAGLPLAWEGDFYGDDVPVWVAAPGVPPAGDTSQGEKGLLLIPYSYDCNDMKLHMAADGFAGASFFEYLRDAFDVLYAEGGRMMSVGLHARIIGKPGRIGQLQRFLEYVCAKPDVWVCTRAEIAAHWRAVHPFEGGGGDAGG